ncbi:MAG: hypothetical protein CSA66_07815 [Proteobacteria bacterium]|nr:MAG: hypothetical protein CSA66_07815 [Pseudomonadota bacterium]
MRRAALIAAVGATLASSPALAAGWDTPILYSAEHMGMGGAAIGFVDDPSAIVFNPAGLAQTDGFTLMANASLLLGSITSSPTATVVDETSAGITAFVPLLGFSYRFSDMVTAGLAVYPVASSGATYRYTQGDGEVDNSTDVLFIEISPSVAINLPANFRLGLGYRASFVSLARRLEPSLTPLSFAMTGWNWAGLRAGLQWSNDVVELGFVYRHRTDNEIEDDEAIVVLADTEVSAKTTLILPSKLGLGARFNVAPLSIVLDAEYTLQSQNDQLVIERDPELAIVINNVFRWKDSLTLRGGLEYSLDDTHLLRVGAIYDSQATTKKWPSAFGTPPGPTTTVTAGYGFKPDDAPWDLNLALAYRFGSATVTQADIEAGLNDEPCQACSKAGNYSLGLFGAYVDFTYSFL